MADIAPKIRRKNSTFNHLDHWKVLTDRTNSLLRQNTTSTTEELLEWTKGICAKYSNIKVTSDLFVFHPQHIPGDQLWYKLAQRSCILCLDTQLLSRPHPIQSAQVDENFKSKQDGKVNSRQNHPFRPQLARHQRQLQVGVRGSREAWCCKAD